jgi:hypothetical protein
MVAGDLGITLIQYADNSDMLSRLRAELAKYSASEGGYARRRTPA